MATVIQAPRSAIAPDPAPAERVLRVRGGAPLRGSVTIGGAKNAALPALAATLLTADECVLNNVPDLADIGTMIALLRSLGAETELDRAAQTRPRARREHRSIPTPRPSSSPTCAPRSSSPVRCWPDSARCPPPRPAAASSARARSTSTCAASARWARPSTSTTTVSTSPDAPRAARRAIYMDYPSHTGTENLLMAATLASGRTTIVNAACEPEIVSLGNMLNRMGARITGLGSPTIIVDGVDRLHGVSETILPDRLEAGTYAIGAVITGGEVTLNDVREPDMLPLTAKLREAGAEVWIDDDRMLVRPSAGLRAVEIQTLPFPGFPTDLQAAFAVLMTQAQGSRGSTSGYSRTACATPTSCARWAPASGSSGCSPSTRPETRPGADPLRHQSGDLRSDPTDRASRALPRHPGRRRCGPGWADRRRRDRGLRFAPPGPRL